MRVEGLAVYPLKSAKGIALPSMVLGSIGPSMDRRWVLIDEANKFVSQRQYPAMALINCCFSREQPTEHALSELRFTAPGMAELRVQPLDLAPPDVMREMVNVSIWHDVCEAAVYATKVNEWFSDYLKISVKLAFMLPATERLIDQNYMARPDRVGFADGFPILLVTNASLRSLNQDFEPPLEIERFRPNIVIDGEFPFEEDDWRCIRIGRVVLDVVKRCSRCVIPSIDPATGEKTAGVSRHLAKQRKSDDGKIYFGMNLTYDRTREEYQPVEIALGDEVEVLG